MERTTGRERERERGWGGEGAQKGEQKTERNWFYDGFQLHGPPPNQLFMTRKTRSLPLRPPSVANHKYKILVSDNMFAAVTCSVEEKKHVLIKIMMCYFQLYLRSGG